MLLQIVPDTGDVRRNLLTVGEANARDLTQSRVRFLRGDRFDLGANAAPLGIARDLKRTQRQVGMTGLGAGLDDTKGRRFDLFLLLFAALTDQLAYRWHFRPLDAHKDGRTVGGPEPPDYSKADQRRQRGSGRRNRSPRQGPGTTDPTSTSTQKRDFRPSENHRLAGKPSL